MKIILSILLAISNLLSQYYIYNGFPNLSFEDPVGIYSPTDGSDRLFVIEQPGQIKVFNNETAIQIANTFLDIRSIVNQGDFYTEEGLLGLAFHPNYSQNGYFYVNYTKYGPRRNIIARYQVNPENPNEGDYNSAVIILEVNQPYSNHNGGQMGFGNDGYLYISFGDGGSSGDPQGNSQNLSNLLGTIIRIDVDNTSPPLNYSIPDDNPFIDTIDARKEIYAYGLRNTWKFSWDSVTGELWGADVGQNAYEEVNIIKSGLNYGWNSMEGFHCFPPGSSCNDTDFEQPVFEYELYVEGVCSVTGGYVYHGTDIMSLQNKYIYGDWCTGDIWAYKRNTDSPDTNEHLINTGINITSFGIDMNNELLICANNSIYKIGSNQGDLNSDGQLNIQDIILLVNHILSQIPNSDLTDINSDGLTNILDIIQLVNLILN